jgi:hypothetical protein
MRRRSPTSSCGWPPLRSSADPTTLGSRTTKGVTAAGQSVFKYFWSQCDSYFHHFLRFYANGYAELEMGTPQLAPEANDVQSPDGWLRG